MSRRSFERFYLEKVAIGEGCGCAEQAIGMRDLDRQARRTTARNISQAARGGLLARLRHLIRLRCDKDTSQR